VLIHNVYNVSISIITLVDERFSLDLSLAFEVVSLFCKFVLELLSLGLERLWLKLMPSHTTER